MACCRSHWSADTGVDVVARYRPGRHQSLLGGDFYDVVECEDGSLFALIGDVAGHGPDEAALGVCLRIAWRTLVLAGADPETILPCMDAVLVSERDSDEVFATVAMVRVDPPGSRRGSGWPVTRARDPRRRRGAGPRRGDRHRPRHRRRCDLARHRHRADPTDSSLMLFTDGLIEGYDGPDAATRLGDTGSARTACSALLSSLLAGGAVRRARGRPARRGRSSATVAS